MGIIYVGLMFWHCNDQRDSWVYMWATIATWLASIAARVFWYNRALNIKAQWFEGANTSLQALPGGMSRLTVSIPLDFRWRAGQHCFLRFPSVSMLDNHPFTIAGHAAADENEADSEAKSEAEKRSLVIFLVRSRTGFTKKLSKFISKSPSHLAACWLDGPYGGLDRKVERAFDTVILIAGGTGVTSSLSWLQHLAAHMRAGTSRTANIQLIWAVREEEHFEWVVRELDEEMRCSAKETISMDFYVTGAVQSNASSLKDANEDKDLEIQEIKGPEKVFPPIHSLGPCHRGRPDLGAKIAQLRMTGRTMVFGESFFA